MQDLPAAPRQIHDACPDAKSVLAVDDAGCRATFAAVSCRGTVLARAAAPANPFRAAGFRSGSRAAGVSTH